MGGWMGSSLRRLGAAARIVGLGLGLGFLAGCAGSSPLGLSPAQESQIGAEQHPRILEAYGGEITDAQLKAYVDGITNRIRANTGTPNMFLQMTVLDSPVVNAFALPGGYIYVTRGLLALANSEAELAAVIGHETGHVIARHTAKRIEQSNVIGIGSVLAGILLGSPQLGNLAGTAGSLYLLNYSRDQEFEADRLGVEYIARAGYDPYAEADFLATMGAQGALASRMSGRAAPPEFLSTHPASVNRVREAIEEAEASGVPVSSAPRKRAEYLNAIDGMIYGDGPSQGYVRGRTFSHPELRFTFTAPNGYRLQNSPSAVVARGPGNISLQLAGGKSSASPQSYVQNELSQSLKVQLGSIQTLTVNGKPAATGATFANTNSGRAFVRVIAIKWNASSYYTFLLIAPANAQSDGESALTQTVNTFRTLSASEANALRPRRIDVVTVRAGDTVQSLGQRMAVDELKVEQFRVLNGLDAGEGLRAGDRVKLVVN